jgi:ferredoxin-fold anticodon binding domain-containing protein
MYSWLQKPSRRQWKKKNYKKSVYKFTYYYEKKSVDRKPITISVSHFMAVEFVDVYKNVP